MAPLLMRLALLPCFACMRLEHHPGRNHVAKRPTGLKRIEGIAGHQRQHRCIRIENETALAGVDYIDTNDPVNMTLATRGFHAEQLTDLELSKELKMRVAMTGDNRVTCLARHCARAQVTWSECQ